MATTNRLWKCHDDHLARIEKTRELMTNERFERGGDLDICDKECNFAPKTIENPFGEQRAPRTFEQCVRDQFQYLSKINERAELKRRVADETAITNPQALEASNKMLENKPREPVFERLSKNQPKAPKRPPADEAVEVKKSEENQIKMHRGAPIQVALYDLQRLKAASL